MGMAGMGKADTVEMVWVDKADTAVTVGGLAAVKSG
jgi:hypothetical protein